MSFEAAGRGQPHEAREAVADAARRKVVQRAQRIAERLHDPQGVRRLAEEVRARATIRLDDLLPLAEKRLADNGIHVHRAASSEDACRLIASICRRAGASVISKSKSMVTEEIALNAHLEREGFRPVETDLGEFVVQIDHDRPTHIVTPIIHKNRRQVAKSFEREGLGPYTEDPEALTMQARAHLRQVFQQAEVGITGANFVVAETGRFVIVTNEGNGRFCATAPRVHIAITGIEKIVEHEADLAPLLKLLARSSTGMDLTVYTHFVSGPRRAGDPDGPEEVHLIFLDNGRSRVAAGPYREMLRCIRCGACLNVCPVYRQVTGHAYGGVYSGPMGAVLSPLLGGEVTLRERAELPFASSLCGACEEVCPVRIPIPRLLLGLRAELQAQGRKPEGTPPFGAWARMASHPLAWRATLAAGRVAKWHGAGLLPGNPLGRWSGERELPEWPAAKETFRAQWRRRKTANEKLSGSMDQFSFSALSDKSDKSDRSGKLCEASEADACRESDRESVIRQLQSAPPAELWKEFACRIEQLGGRAILCESSADARAWLLALAAERKLRRVISDMEAIRLLNWDNGDAESACLDIAAPGDRAAAFEAEIGLTTCDLAIAETGTVVLRSNSERARLASLAPPIHVAILPLPRLVADIFDAINPQSQRSKSKSASAPHLSPPAGEVWITGSSRTADIEGIIVHGVHGPRELIILGIPAAVDE